MANLEWDEYGRPTLRNRHGGILQLDVHGQSSQPWMSDRTELSLAVDCGCSSISLSREDVERLIPLLNRFVATGKLAPEQAKDGAV